METTTVCHIFILLILPVLGGAVSAVIQNKSTELHEKLFTWYEPQDTPSFMTGTPTSVSVSYHLTALMDINELAGEMVTIGYLTVIWVDTRLTWNPLEYGGITYLILNSALLWTPNLLLGNPSRKVTNFNADVARVRLLYNGTVIFMPGDVFHTRCEHDIYKYPFDKQECHLSFLSWPYTVNEVQLMIPDREITTPFFQENGEWYLRSFNTKTYIESSISVAEYNLVLERRSEFFIVNIILPIVSICFLACLVFLIPHESGERVSYTITVLLSFAVFMTLVSDNIPKTSAPMSLLCYYLFALFFGSVLIMLNVIFNSRLFYKDPIQPVSGFFKRITCYSCKRKPTTFPGKKNRIHMLTVTDTTLADEIKTRGFCEDKKEPIYGGNNNKTDELTWQQVALALDKICFVGYVLYFIILSVSIVLIVQV